MTESKQPQTFADAVVAARSAFGRGSAANWELAHLTYQWTRDHSGSPKADGSDEGKVTIQQWCNAVAPYDGPKGQQNYGFALRTAQLYRARWAKLVAGAYGDTLAAKIAVSPIDYAQLPSWTEIDTDENPAKSSVSVQERAAEKFISEATPEQKREIVSKLVQEAAVEAPAIIADLMTDQNVRQAAQKAISAHAVEQFEHGKQLAQTDPVVRAANQESALYDLDDACRKFANAVERLLPLVNKMTTESMGQPTKHDVFLGESSERALDAAQRVRTLATTGKTDLDMFLDATLKGAE